MKVYNCKCVRCVCMAFIKVYRSTRYVFIHCLWLKIEFYVNLKPWIIDPAIYNTNLETLAKLDTFWYFSKILGDFLKSSVITPLKIVSVCRYGERDMSTFKSVSLLGWINSDSKDFNFEGWCKVDKNKPSRYINLVIYRQNQEREDLQQ